MNRSSQRAKNRTAVLGLVLFGLFVLIFGGTACGGGGGGSSTTGGGTTGTAPSPPTNLTATPGDTKITLNWNASAAVVHAPQSTTVQYNVYRSLSATAGFSKIISGVTGTSFTNTGLTNGTTYFYQVTAQNANGESGPSNTASATPFHVVVGNTWLPGNTIFYTAADVADPTATDLRKVTPLGTGDSLFALMPSQVDAAAPNPNVTNQFVFAYTSDTTITPSSVYALYKNNSVSVSGATKLTDAVSNPFTHVGSIGFTPDGQKIFFTAEESGTHSLFFMNPDGTNVVPVAQADDASLSPDGTKILISQPKGGQDDLAYISISDPSLTQVPVLQTTGQDEIMPQWSKDGTKIVFSAESLSDASPNFEIFEVPFGSTTTTQITANGDDNFSPSLSPDGTQVGFTRISGSNVANDGVYKAPTAGGASTAIVLNTSVGTSLYWTNNNGRGIGGGDSMTLGHTLRHLRIKR